MLYKSTVIAAGSGSIAGATFSHGRFGQYIRARTIPVNSNTEFQQEVRNTFSTYASRWTSVLTAAQRSGWETYAANVPVVGPLGDARNLTGLNWYVACNTLRAQAGLATVDDAPAIFSQDTFTPVTITISEATQVITVSYTNTDGWANEVGGSLIYSASRPFSPSINFFAGPYRFSNNQNGGAVPPVSPDTGPVPFAVQEGQKVGLFVRSVRADGRISNAQRLTVIVAA